MKDFINIIDKLEADKSVKFLRSLIAFNTTKPPWRRDGPC